MDGAKAVEGVDEIPPDDVPIIFTRMITIVSEKRQNAIDVTSSNLIQSLRMLGDIKVIEMDHAQTSGQFKKAMDLINVLRLVFKTSRTDVLLFLDPKTLKCPRRKRPMFFASIAWPSMCFSRAQMQAKSCV